VTVYWLFIGLQKTFGAVAGQALWWKLGRKGQQLDLLKE
jgi:hypothetical protein